MFDSKLRTAIKDALDEDLGLAGDITSNAVLDDGVGSQSKIVARQPGTIAGLPVVSEVFDILDPELGVRSHHQDGDGVQAGDTLISLVGSAHSILAGERTALNFLGHLSGIATTTAKLVELVSEYDVKITDTRKTTPLWRQLEKYAVRMGGGHNHRFGLYDAVLIKDNHIAACGSVTTAVRRAKSVVGHLVKIEVEVDNLEQLGELLEEGADVVLLDNFDLASLSQAVKLVDKRMQIEASGGVNATNIAQIAATGVDYIAVGAITHSAPSLDVSLDLNPLPKAQ